MAGIDATLAWRRLARAPLSALGRITIAAVAAAVAMAGAMFARTLIHDLNPFPAAVDVVTIEIAGDSADSRLSWTPGDVAQDLAARTDLLSQLAAYRPGSQSLVVANPARVVQTAFGTSSLFSMLGVGPIAGRLFVEADAKQHADVVLLRHAFARNLLGTADNAVGKLIDVEGKSFQVVGILPDSVAALVDGEVWFPYEPDASDRSRRYVHVVARLRSNITSDLAATELSALSGRLAAQFPRTHRDARTVVIGALRKMTPAEQKGIGVLAFMCGCVVFIALSSLACTKVAHEMARQSATAVRLTLGGGARALVWELLTDAVMVALTGALLGGVAAQFLVRHLADASRSGVLSELTLQWTDMLGGTAFLLATMVVANGLACLLIWRDVSMASASFGDRLTSRLRWRHGILVVFQLTAVMVLSAAALSIGDTVARQRAIDLGWQPAGRWVAFVKMPSAAGTAITVDAQTALTQRIADTIAAVVSTDRVGATNSMPLAGPSFGTDVSVPGGRADRPFRMQVRFVTKQYCEAMNLRVRSGESFQSGLSPTEPVLLVSRRAATMLWPDEAAVGRIAHVAIAKGMPFRVVGVVDDVRHRLNQEPEPTVYLSSEQFASLGDVAFVFTPGSADETVGPAVRQSVAGLSAPAAVTDVVPAERLVDRSMPIQLLAQRAVWAASLGVSGSAVVSIIALVGTVLAGRRKEHAIRAALGMSPARFAATVYTEWMLWASTAIICGAFLLLAADRATAAAITGVRLATVGTMLTAAFVVLLLVACAVAVPTYKASVGQPDSGLRIA